MPGRRLKADVVLRMVSAGQSTCGKEGGGAVAVWEQEVDLHQGSCEIIGCEARARGQALPAETPLINIDTTKNSRVFELDFHLAISKHTQKESPFQKIKKLNLLMSYMASQQSASACMCMRPGSLAWCSQRGSGPVGRVHLMGFQVPLVQVPNNGCEAVQGSQGCQGHPPPFKARGIQPFAQSHNCLVSLAWYLQQTALSGCNTVIF